MLFRVVLPHAVFGVVVINDKVVQTAPIAKWAQGKSWQYVHAYYTKKGAIIECINQKIT